MSPPPSYETNTHHRVLRIRETIAFPDPDMPQPRYHHSIFVETNTQTGSGIVHHVVGDITSTNGMTYQSKSADSPLTLENLFDLLELGWVARTNYPQRFEQVLARLPTPPKQKHFNAATRKTEPMRPEGGFYAAGEERTPLWKCTEWTEMFAVPALSRAGLLVDGAHGTLPEASLTASSS